MGSRLKIIFATQSHATVKFLYEPDVSYVELVEGALFEILEGPRVIGYGEIIRR